MAGSAYYKLLIGQLLGYKLANVVGYVAASGEPPSAQLQQQVSHSPVLVKYVGLCRAHNKLKLLSCCTCVDPGAAEQA